MLYVTPKQKNVAELQRETVFNVREHLHSNPDLETDYPYRRSITFLGTSRKMMYLKIIFPSSYLLLL
jgi:hypothetical protein